MLLFNLLASALISLENRVEHSQQHEHDAYLAAATDCADLECRIRAADRAAPWIPHYG